jgi:hypothetical protein
MSFTDIKRPLHILMVEDSESDSLLLREAILETQSPHRLTIRRDGQAANEFLNQDFHPTTNPAPLWCFSISSCPTSTGWMC